MPRENDAFKIQTHLFSSVDIRNINFKDNQSLIKSSVIFDTWEMSATFTRLTIYAFKNVN